MMKPTNLAQMMEATQLVEERNKVLYLGWVGAGGPWVKNTKPAPSQPSLRSFSSMPQMNPSRDFALKPTIPLASHMSGFSSSATGSGEASMLRRTTRIRRFIDTERQRR